MSTTAFAAAATTAVEQVPSPARPVSDAQIAANRANAQKSTGPTSQEGKAKASLNAVKTGLTGHTVLLPTDDVAAYQAHLARHFRDLSPDTEAETVLAQLIADTEWRIIRIASLEEGTWSHGHYTLGDLFPEVDDPSIRHQLIRAEILKQYHREFKNLALQEGRLNRQLEKHLAELKRIQGLRRANEKTQIQRAADLINLGKDEGKNVDLRNFGFEFSTAEYLHFLTATQFEFDALGARPPIKKVIAAYRAARKTA